MRDEHLDSSHQEAKSQAELLANNLDEDEIQPLLFDLIRLDKVEAVKTILHHSNTLNSSVKEELIKLAAFSGSAAMVQLVYNHYEGDTLRGSSHFLIKSLQGMNFETLRWFVSSIENRGQKEGRNLFPTRDLLVALLKSGSLEMFQECEKYLIDDLSTESVNRPRQRRIPPAAAATSLFQDVIKATARCPDRENLLLSLWAALEMRNTTSKFNSKTNLGDALGYVAETTCSLALAKVLLEYGAKIDFRRCFTYPTPLHRAARQSSPHAAELMKFLLYQGADPELQAGRTRLKMSEEKGAKGIAKWLEMSWDELIQKVKLDRERGICPPEYT
jgi:Ankyrin repeat